LAQVGPTSMVGSTCGPLERGALSLSKGPGMIALRRGLRFPGCRFAHPRLPAGTPAGVLGKGGFRRI